MYAYKVIFSDASQYKYFDVDASNFNYNLFIGFSKFADQVENTFELVFGDAGYKNGIS